MYQQVDLVFRSAHGDRSIICGTTESIVDVCRKYGLPTTQVSTYLEKSDGSLRLFVKPYAPLGDFSEGNRIVVIPNRNIDYHALLGGKDIVRENPEASTWIRIREDGPEDVRGFVTEFLRPEDARALVASQVRDVLVDVSLRDEPLVVGVSGGGDSNALLGALVESGMISKSNLFPVMMLGIPDWDSGVDRAEALCADYGLKLRTVSDDQTARILGFENPNEDWVTQFEKIFPSDDLEVLGVYGVRKVLEHVATEVGAKRIVIGSNLEDCLSDVFYYLCAGQPPFPKPLGQMGPVEILYPLWLTPKALIDGCYPKFSLANYEARYPSKMLGRAYFYYLAQMMVDAYPGAGQDILRGGQLPLKGTLSRSKVRRGVRHPCGSSNSARCPYQITQDVREIRQRRRRWPGWRGNNREVRNA